MINESVKEEFSVLPNEGAADAEVDEDLGMPTDSQSHLAVVEKHKDRSNLEIEMDLLAELDARHQGQAHLKEAQALAKKVRKRRES
jgi:hypothetical protein